MEILLREEEIKEYVFDSLCDIRYSGCEISNAKYHHNTAYKDAASICKYGILNILDLNKKGLRNDSDEMLAIFGDIESHINGDDRISLAVVGLDDLYADKFEYNPFNPSFVDFLVTSDLKTSKTSIHYGNEYLSFGSIENKDIRSVDVRLLELDRQSNISPMVILENYNYLRDIALELQLQELDIPLREMSDTSVFDLDVDKLVDRPMVKLKKY